MRTRRSVLITLVLACCFIGNIARSIGFHDAVETGDLKKVKAMLAVNPDYANTPKFGSEAMPLLLAVQNGQKDVMKVLLQYGAKPNFQYAGKELFDWTAYDSARSRGRQDIAWILFKHGGRPGWWLTVRWFVYGLVAVGIAKLFWRAKRRKKETK